MPEITPFKDIALSFKRNKITNDLLTKKDSDAVNQSVINILLTNKGERLYDAAYGSNVRRYLFEPLDYGVAGSIKSEIRESLSRYEPRVRITQLECEPDFDTNGFDVRLEYKILGRDDLPPRSLEFFLNRSQ